MEDKTPFQTALETDVPKGYADYVWVELGWSDISISFHHLGKPVGVITLPQGLAKAMAANITSGLQGLQDATGAQIFTPGELEQMSKRTKG